MSGSTAKSIALVAPGVGCGSSANTSPWSPAAKSMLLNPESILLNDFDLLSRTIPQRNSMFVDCPPRALERKRIYSTVPSSTAPGTTCTVSKNRWSRSTVLYNTVTCTSGVPMAGSWDVTLSPTLPSNQDQTRSGSSETSIGPVSVLTLTGARFFSRGDVTSSLRPSQHGA